MRQGYLLSSPDRTVRIRITGDDAFLTIKGPTRQLRRLEFEYHVPRLDAETLLEQLCERPLIEKTRRRQKVGDKIWEIDAFHGENEGLILAEVELVSEWETVELPYWVGEEVSTDLRYFNSNLTRRPFKRWMTS
jgi:adenylate cyclase